MASTTKNSKSGTTWTPNATYPEMPKELATGVGTKMEVLYDFGVDNRVTVHMYGDHGIGKTSALKYIAKQRGHKVVYINLANITPDDKMAVAPTKLANGELALKQMVTKDLVPGEPFVLMLDDGRQASQAVQNQFMQVTCNWAIGQNPLVDCVGVFLLDNEGTAEGIRTSEDPAVADRKVTTKLTANDTGARYALARKYATADLKGVFRIYDSLEPELRYVLSWRCLDHVLYCLLNGFPGIYGLPLMGGERLRLVGSKTVEGKKAPLDRTAEILDKIAAALGVRNPEKVPDLTRKVIRAAIRDRLTVLIQGPPGCGKTELLKSEVAAAGKELVYYSMPFTSPDALIVPMPTPEGTLEMLIAEELRRPGQPGATEAVIGWDEYNRPSSKATFAKLMEMTQEWSLGGVDLDGITAQIALCNPPVWQGRKMGVSRNNIAQADRFTISIEVTPEDIPANEWLIATYGPVAETVLEWWKSDIDDSGREWITKRTLERFIKLHQAGLPLEMGKIYLGEGDYAPVPLIDLEARLAKRPMARLREIADNLEEWEARLKVASETSEEGTNDVDQVHQALALSELTQLWEHIDAVVRLVRYLPPKLKGTFFIGASEAEQKFWIETFKRMTGR